MLRLKECYEDLGKLEEIEALAGSGKMAKEDFVANGASILSQ